MSSEWNHNTHYHSLLLASVPRPCVHALDVGCGQGLLARQMAPLCERVTGIDLDAEALATAKSQPGNVQLIHGDALTYPFPDSSFDFIATVATLHHMPLDAALDRFAGLLKPGGTLAVVGLYRLQTPQDYLLAAIARPAGWMLRRRYGFARVGAPVQAPREGLAEIRDAAAMHLPGSVLRRRLLFRYILLWRKPSGGFPEGVSTAIPPSRR